MAALLAFPLIVMGIIALLFAEIVNKSAVPNTP